MNSLHILQGEFLGTQPLIRTLNFSRNLNFFISMGILSNGFGPTEDPVTVPYLSVHGMLRLQLDWFLRL